MRAGIIHPGEMGAAVAAALVDRGHQVSWASRGRSADTARRAAEAGLGDAATVERLVDGSEVILSVCPPHAALAVADEVGGLGFHGTYLDANAISPATAERVADRVTAGGATYVDGGIVGSPPRQAGTTRLYLSGEGAEGLARDLFLDSRLEAVVLPSSAFAASALKMVYAGWTKGSAALILAIRAAARRHGVEADLAAEWARSGPGLEGRVEAAAGSARGKGWRWIGEMEEIAATLEQAGLPAGFHLAAADVYRRTPRGEIGPDILDRVLDELLGA
ncbi:MAG TPA: DUF1932 domain-containing protein [Candidatus Dormibacteraeota bacterium]|jgi:3-hydroxyisobutyrate dehydrogenase-like beta-hydroxyacid dehydrogenase|nr:DUF1932 domain-containing protein [Candidatus Dormibacteraeota bacterium]